MFKGIVLPLAKEDILQAVYWYNSKNNNLGKLFIKEIRSKVLFICENPFTTEVRYDSIRCLVLETLPFIIHYATDDIKKEVIVVAVFHTSLSPDKWGQRK